VERGEGLKKSRFLGKWCVAERGGFPPSSIQRTSCKEQEEMTDVTRSENAPFFRTESEERVTKEMGFQSNASSES